MVTRYRAKATKATSVFCPFWHILFTKQDLRKKVGGKVKLSNLNLNQVHLWPVWKQEGETTERSMILSLSSKYEWN